VTELTEAKQRQDESVDDFIAIWINLELSCEQACSSCSSSSRAGA